MPDSSSTPVTKAFLLRLSPEEHEQLKSNAAKARTSITDLIKERVCCSQLPAATPQLNKPQSALRWTIIEHLADLVIDVNPILVTEPFNLNTEESDWLREQVVLLIPELSREGAHQVVGMIWARAADKRYP